ncbi:MAG: Fe-S cluster assembly scaffold protein NifU [Vallitalea sp.]|jgi:nitrogen fixation NifU-like protein|nr:Fe-S cluster assembly scaffold protein NifU [Vallitalea sp.]
MYTKKVMDHFMNPRNMGELENADGVGTVGNAKCGDIMRIYLKVEDEIIQDVTFKTFGCGAAVATSSIATELVKGKTIQEALKITNDAVVEALDGLPKAKIHCSLLAEEALHAALWDYSKKHGIEIEGLVEPKSDIGEHEHDEEDEI